MNSIESYNYKLSKFLKVSQVSIQSQLDVNFEIPNDPQKFYEDFGLLEHPRTGEPSLKLTPYQYAIWKDSQHYKYRLTIKSQKIGITTSSLMEDFQKAITTCRGKEILIIAQNLRLARDHIYTLRKMIKASQKYSRFLIEKPSEILLRDEVTKLSVIFLRNPSNPKKPTRIIGLGPSEGSVWSWKEVKHIHMSDVAATNMIDDSGLFAATFSRLANTSGTIHIETPPRGQRGMVWEIYKTSKLKTGNEDAEEAKFHVREIAADQAVQADLVTQDFLNAERERLGPQYSQYYECEFLNSSNVWYDEELFSYTDDAEVTW